MYIGNAPLTSLAKTPRALPDTPPHALTDVSGDVWGLCYLDRDTRTAYYNLIPVYDDACWQPLTQMVIQGQWGVLCQWWLVHHPYPRSAASIHSCWSCRTAGYVRPTCPQCQAFQVAHRITGCQDCLNSEAVHSLRQNVIVSPYAAL